MFRSALSPFGPALLPALLVTLLLALAPGCGGAQDTGLSVEPEPRVVAVGDQLPLTAHPGMDLSGDLEWEVAEPYGGGLRNSQGLETVYFAPGAAGTYHLVLRALRNDGRRLKQTVEIRVLPLPTLDPSSVEAAPNETVSFAASMKGMGRNTVTWAVEEAGGGEISEDGRYRAPARPGTYHVIATSTLDPAVVARATVVVRD